MKGLQLILALLLCSTTLFGREPILIDSVDTLVENHAVRFTLDGVVEQHIRGNLPLAKELYLRAVAADSLYAPPLYYLSGIYSLQSADSALNFAQRAYRLDSVNRWYAKRYAFLEMSAGSVERSLELYEQLVSGDDADLESFQQKAMAHQRSDDFIGAIEVLDSAHSRFGFSPSIGATQLEIYASKLNRVDKAQQVAQRILDASAGDIEMRMGVASLYFSSGLDSLAIKQVEVAIEGDSLDIRPRILLVEMYESLGDYPSLFGEVRSIMAMDNLELEYKITIFEEFISDAQFYAAYYFYINELAALLWAKYPQWDRVLELYTKHLIAGGMLERASDVYRDLVEAQGYSNFDHIDVLIDLESYLKRAKEVEKIVRKAVKIYPDSLALYPSVGYAYFYADELEGAVKAFKWATRYCHSDSEMTSSLWSGIGDAYQSMAKRSEKPSKRASLIKKGYEAYEESIRYNPSNSLTLNNYAYALTQNEPTEQSIVHALVMSTRANAIMANNASYLDTQGYILFLMGDYQRAKTLINQALTLDGGNSEILFHYAEVLAALSEFFLSQVYFERAEAAGYDKGVVEAKIEELKRLKSER